MENLKIKEWLDPNDNYKYQKCSLVATGSGFIEIPDGAELLTASGKELVFWKNDGQYSFHTVNSIGWDKAENGLCDLSDYMDSSVKIVWQREQIQQEQGLISGADALNDYSNAQVSYDFGNGEYKWFPLDQCEFSIPQILKGHNDAYDSFALAKLVFRLKPRTITLNVEIPAPFEPKDGEIFWFVSPYTYKGYDSKYFVDDCTGFLLNGVWRTEEQVKQVVAALRGGIKG